jgi:hypothetical protein
MPWYPSLYFYSNSLIERLFNLSCPSLFYSYAGYYTVAISPFDKFDK